MVKKKTTPGGSKNLKPSEENGHQQAAEDEKLSEVEQSIIELRLRAKEDENVDVSKELRLIQDQIADARGVPRRPITAKPGHEEELGHEDEDEEEQEEEDPDAEAKELINKRLTTCMLLALSYEADEDYPKDFYEKLAESGKYDEVVKPFSKEEIKELNQLLKERKHEANERVKKATLAKQEHEENGDDLLDEKQNKAKKTTPAGKSKKPKK